MNNSTYKKYCLVIDEYCVNGFNGTQAYKKFYPNAKRADDSFSKIQRIPEIQEYLKSKQNNAKQILRTSHEALLQELENWAFSDITETILLTPEEVKALPEIKRRLINKFKQTTRTYIVDNTINKETVIELSFVSKEKAMEMIHKHVGFYENDNKQRSSLVLESREERDAYLRDIEEKIKKNANH